MFKLIISVFVILVPFISGSNVTGQAENKVKNITDFFPEARGNLTKITWAHAVNSQDLLTEALNSTNCTVMMLEADVVLGQLNGTQQIIPIMAHPPENISDLSLQDFLKKVQEFNTKVNNTAQKGVKLDFKTIETFNASVSVIKDLYPKMQYPLWLNADILSGPLNSTVKPVNATDFLKASKYFENSTLSLGWTTTNDTKASYTDPQISEMLEAIKQNNVTQLITFPVRASIAAQSLNQLEGLVKKVTNSTLTLWNGAGDTVDVEGVRKLIAKVGIERVFIDLPDELKNKLRLHQLSGVSSTVKPVAFISLILTMFMKFL